MGSADVQIDIDPSVIVTAKRDSLHRGISNLVRNAVRYAGSAGPIRLSVLKRDGMAILTISDQGPGIPEEAIEKIFTPFYRFDASRDRKTGGSGLGMSIARACVESCRGTISCRNLSPGLQVTITLPVASEEARTSSTTG